MVENAVYQCQRFILTALRGRQFFSLEEINRAISKELLKLNARLLGELLKYPQHLNASSTVAPVSKSHATISLVHRSLMVPSINHPSLVWKNVISDTNFVLGVFALKLRFSRLVVGRSSTKQLFRPRGKLFLSLRILAFRPKACINRATRL